MSEALILICVKRVSPLSPYQTLSRLCSFFQYGSGGRISKRDAICAECHFGLLAAAYWPNETDLIVIDGCAFYS